MQRLQGLYGLILLLFSNVIFADIGRIYVGATLGTNTSDIRGTPQIHYYNGNLTDAYPFSDNNPTRFMPGLNAGFEFASASFRPAIALGLGIYSLPSPLTFEGRLIETAKGDPAFVLYHYHFNLQSTRLMFEAQFMWMMKQLSPFIQIGIGPAWNHLNGYNESSVDNVSCVALPPFHSHTNLNLAYQIGIGVAYAFNFPHYEASSPKERISLTYRYVNLGDNSFGTRGSDYPFKLDTDNLKSTEIFVTFTHLFST